MIFYENEEDNKEEGDEGKAGHARERRGNDGAVPSNHAIMKKAVKK
jgi:hypothetical protein